MTTPPNEPVRRAFVIVGMHRSGTSAMARTLSLLGAALPKTLIAAAQDNETGFWEPQKVANLNDEILQALDSDWDDVFAFRPRSYLSNFDHFYLGRAAELLEQEFDGSEIIVLKDPRISVLTPFWSRALRRAGYVTHHIVMVRNPIEVAESLRARNGFPREKSLLLWSSYMIAADRDTRGLDRTFVAYDQLIHDWRSVRNRIEANAGVPFPRNTAAAAIEIDRFLDRSHRHHRESADEFYARADVPDEVKALFRIFSGACEGAEIDDAMIEKIHAELEKMDLMVGPLLADLRASARKLSHEVAELSVARDRASALEEELAAVQALRQDDLETASRVNETYEGQLAELIQRADAAEAERDRLAAELAERLSAAESDRDRAAAERDLIAREMEGLASRLASAEGDRERAIEERDSSALEVTQLSENLQVARAELAAREADLELKQEAVESARAEADGIREKAQRDLEVVIIASREAREKADAAAKANESKLAQRYQETATLTKLLRQEEQRAEAVDENLQWLLALSQRLADQPRWWNLMPRPWARRRRLELLRNSGLFDGTAYLRNHPDVASTGADPLEHYLEYGLNEGRIRKN